MRLIVVGDLHGCAGELEDLVEIVRPEGDDVVACVGDFATKGPWPERCLDLWRERGWSGVLGNNDRDVLDVIRGARASSAGTATDARRLEARPDLVAYLESLPLYLDFEERGCAVVHGGVLPGTSFHGGILHERLLTLRDVVPVGESWRAAPSADPAGTRRFWADVWDGDRFVVYGHTPRPEPAWHRRALGIDTGCVYGWSLTVAVHSEDGTWSTVSVPARREWAKR